MVSNAGLSDSSYNLKVDCCPSCPPPPLLRQLPRTACTLSRFLPPAPLPLPRSHGGGRLPTRAPSACPLTPASTATHPLLKLFALKHDIEESCMYAEHMHNLLFVIPSLLPFGGWIFLTQRKVYRPDPSLAALSICPLPLVQPHAQPAVQFVEGGAGVEERARHLQWREAVGGGDGDLAAGAAAAVRYGVGQGAGVAKRQEAGINPEVEELGVRPCEVRVGREPSLRGSILNI